MKRVSIIGGGISGLSAACYLAKQGHKVSLFEKNTDLGGRCRRYNEQGFIFDMGPSWYWMPDIFERFYNDFGKTTSDFYELVKLDPGFQIFFGIGETLQIPGNIEELYNVFERIENGSAARLKHYMIEAEWKYVTGMQQLAYKPSLSWTEYARLDVLRSIRRTDLFKPMSQYVRKFFKDKRLIALMEFPVLFLGAMPDKIPALYSLMNYAALAQGTFYPMGGMYKIIEAMESIAKSLGVNIYTGSDVQSIGVSSWSARHIIANERAYETDAVVAACDYHHAEQTLLDEPYRNYDKDYWEKRIMAPSCLIFYVGVSKKIKKLLHHNLFFDTDFDTHAKEIYTLPAWPSNPMFYVCAPGKTDPVVAPDGMENLFLLVPIAPGLDNNADAHHQYFTLLINRIEQLTGEVAMPHVVYKKSYCIDDFVNDYNSYKGNAYGLANTLMQTALLKPSIRNKKVDNLFYAGQLTVPGPGVPPSLISGQIAAEQVGKYFKKYSYYESAF